MREVEFTSDRHLDLGSRFALWVSEMIEDEMQLFSREGRVFLGVGDVQARARAQRTCYSNVIPEA
jgi:hypothetical protein